MKLSIISINFKKPHLTIACIESLWKQYKKEFQSNEFEYIVIDNISGDDSIQLLSKEIKKYKNFHLIENDTNPGYGTTNNLGAKKAKGEYLLFLNNDTVIEDSGLLKMIAYLKMHPDIGVLGGQVKNLDGTEQVAAGKFYSLFSFTLFMLGMQRIGLDKNPSNIQDVDWVKGALMMVNRSVFDRIGGFDEHIFMYTEDMELCFRVHQLGLRCVYFPNIEVRHKDQGTTNRTFAIVHIYKYLPYFYKKHKSAFEYWYVITLLRIKAYMLIAVGYLLKSHYLVNTYTQGLKGIE